MTPVVDIEVLSDPCIAGLVAVLPIKSQVFVNSVSCTANFLKDDIAKPHPIIRRVVVTHEIKDEVVVVAVHRRGRQVKTSLIASVTRCIQHRKTQKVDVWGIDWPSTVYSTRVWGISGAAACVVEAAIAYSPFHEYISGISRDCRRLI